jgi:shikimate kinase
VANIYLVGFMGAGKTAVGRVVARRLGRAFVDLDEAIERQSQLSILEIFETRGEDQFRSAETEELERTTHQSELVIATGGGAFSSSINRRMIRRSGGVSVFLDPPWEAISLRLGEGDADRPKWVDERHARALFLQRRPEYLIADIHLELQGGQSPTEVADKVCSALSEVQCAS